MANREIIEEKSYKTVYREGNVIVKEFTPSHPKANVFNEAYIHTCVEEAGVQVPRIISVTPANGGWALSMEYVSGKTLEQMIQEEAYYVGDLNRQTIMEIWNGREMLDFIYPQRDKFKDM